VSSRASAAVRPVERQHALHEVDASDIVASYIAYFGVWEPNLTSWLEGRLRPGDVFVDVGANVGCPRALRIRSLRD
jgi:hypothetical protein